MARGRSQFSSTMQQYGLVPERGVISILVVLAVVWLLFRFGGDAMGALLSHLVLIPSRGIGREPWQLLTSVFINPRLSDILMAAVTLLFFGNAVERTLGAGAVWKVFIAGGLAGSIAAALMGLLIAPSAVLVGSVGASTAMLTAFAASAGMMRVSFFGAGDIRPGTMAWIWLGISVIFAVVQVEDVGWARVILNLCMIGGSAGAGWLVGGRGRRSTGGGFDIGGSIDKLKLWRLRRRYKVLNGGRDSRDTKNYLN